VEKALFERLVLPTLQVSYFTTGFAFMIYFPSQDEFIRHLLTTSSQREEEIDFIESQMLLLGYESEANDDLNSQPPKVE
jgi:hypothetical protein